MMEAVKVSAAVAMESKDEDTWSLISRVDVSKRGMCGSKISTVVHST